MSPCCQLYLTSLEYRQLRFSVLRSPTFFQLISMLRMSLPHVHRRSTPYEFSGIMD